jgi:hypothetical protein
VLLLFRNIFQLPAPHCPLSSNGSIERLSAITQSTQRVVLVKSQGIMGWKPTPRFLVTLLSLVHLSIEATATPMTKSNTQTIRTFTSKELQNAYLKGYKSSQEIKPTLVGSVASVAQIKIASGLGLNFFTWLWPAASHDTLHSLENSPITFATAKTAAPHDILDSLENSPTAFSIVTTLLQFFYIKALPFLSRTGILRELLIALFVVYLDSVFCHCGTVNRTATIQAAFGDQRRATCSIQEPMTEENKRKLLTESERYFNFSKAAYSIVPGKENVTKSIAEQLDIAEDQILFLTPPTRTDSSAHHFVAVDKQTNSVVLAIRGSKSVSDYCVDATAATGT